MKEIFVQWAYFQRSSLRKRPLNLSYVAQFENFRIYKVPCTYKARNWTVIRSQRITKSRGKGLVSDFEKIRQDWKLFKNQRTTNLINGYSDGYKGIFRHAKVHTFHSGVTQQHNKLTDKGIWYSNVNHKNRLKSLNISGKKLFLM